MGRLTYLETIKNQERWESRYSKRIRGNLKVKRWGVTKHERFRTCLDMSLRINCRSNLKEHVSKLNLYRSSKSHSQTNQSLIWRRGGKMSYLTSSNFRWFFRLFEYLWWETYKSCFKRPRSANSFDNLM